MNNQTGDGDRTNKMSLPVKIPVNPTISGTRRVLETAPGATLLDALRGQRRLTGTKKGCDHGQCEACATRLDGKRINSCLTLAVMKDGSQIAKRQRKYRAKIKVSVRIIS